MRPKVGAADRFERAYSERFRTFAVEHGLLVRYEDDRAALDLGLHLFGEEALQHTTVSDTRIWFQLKGVMSATVPLEVYAGLSDVPVRIETRHLQYWVAHPEPVYLVLYVEAADEFLAEDVQELAERCWGKPGLDGTTFPRDTTTTQVRLRRDAVVDVGFWKGLRSHRSMRVDRPRFRGRPLGHRLDPLRCRMRSMAPRDFLAVVERLLRLHRFRPVAELEEVSFLPNGSVPDARLHVGVMTDTLEWIFGESVRLSVDSGWEYREDGQLFRHQGPCAILIVPRPETLKSRSSPPVLSFESLKLAHPDIERLIVFVNGDGLEYVGAGSPIGSAAAQAQLRCESIRLNDLAFSVLTTTLFHEFRDRLSWEHFAYLIASDLPSWISFPGDNGAHPEFRAFELPSRDPADA